MVAVVALLSAACTGGDGEPESEGSDVGNGSILSDTVPADGATASGEADIMVDDDDVVASPAPLAVVAVQGPIDESASYVSVSWSHVGLGRHPDADPTVLGYEVARDGRIVAETVVDDEPWDDMAVQDAAVTAGDHRYQVRARLSAGPGPWSEPANVMVRSTADVGPVFAVDDYSGTDLERTEQAVADAEEAGGGVVQFDAGTYSFDDTLVIRGSGVLLRGAGQDATVVRPAFAGTDESCGRVTPLVLFRGDPVDLDVDVAVTAPRGSTRIAVNGPPPVKVGDFVEIDGIRGQFPTYEYEGLGIAQDPSIGNDERYPFDAGTIVAVDDASVTFDHPMSPVLPAGSTLFVYDTGVGNGVERLTLEGGGPEDSSYHRLIDASYQVDFRMADVTARWPNRNFLDASGHRITLVGFTGIDGGANGYQPEPCKYKVGFGPATNVTVVDSTFGSADDDRNMSLMTLQFVYRALIRNSVFGASRTYGVNEHGGGSRDVVIENNWIGAGASGWAGILLGNDTWGFSGETAVRNNQFVDNVVDVLMVENSYGIVVAGNRSVGCVQNCLTWSGWGGSGSGDSAITESDNFGSAHLVVTGNRFGGRGGIALGVEESNGFPWIGVRDVVVTDNVVESDTDPALRIEGDASVTGRLWVTGNRFDGDVSSATPGSDWWLWDNTAGPTTTGEPLPPWVELHQAWESGETS